MRKWIAGAALAAVAAAGVALYLVRGGPPAQAQGVVLGRAMVALLPPQTTSLVGVDVERLKGTPLYRYFEDQAQAGNGVNELEQFTARTGFDPRRDVQNLLVASWTDPAAPVTTAPMTGPAGLSGEFVAVARGQFNVPQLSQQFKDKKSAVESYRGFEVFGPAPGPARGRRRAESQQQDHGRFVFLDDKTAVAGTRAAVLAAIDRKLGGGPSLLDKPALLNRAQTIVGSNQVWAVSDSPGAFVTRAMPKESPGATSNFARIFSSLKGSSFALDLTNGLDLKAGGECQSPQDAKTLGDAARGVAALGRLSVSQEQPELMVLFDGIDVQERNAELSIAVHLDAQNFQKLLETTKTRHRTQKVRLELHSSPL